MNRYARVVMRGLAGLAAVMLLIFSAATSALILFGDGLRSVRITGNTVVATVGLPGIVGTEFILEFEQVERLTVQNLGISAELVNPLTLRRRLPAGFGLLAVALPLQIVVEPPRGGGLAFRNTVRAELHTHMLGFRFDSPLRLYKAPHGGTFHDLTGSVTEGSVRTSGRTGGFSDFVMVLDLLPSREHVEDKLEYLDARVDTPSISPAVRALLEADLAAVRAALAAGDHDAAESAVAEFVADVRAHAGTGIPNLWRSARDRDNVAGDLIGSAESLAFSIDRASREH